MLAKTEKQRAQARRDALTELIEDALILKEAARLKLDVRNDEVETALTEVARANQLSVAQLIAETKRQGLAEDYRVTLRRKLLELKWLNARVSRMNQPTTDAERHAFMVAERVRLMAELKAGAVIEVRR